jgi:hypothetical protein
MEVERGGGPGPRDGSEPPREAVAWGRDVRYRLCWYALLCAFVCLFARLLPEAEPRPGLGGGRGKADQSTAPKGERPRDDEVLTLIELHSQVT